MSQISEPLNSKHKKSDFSFGKVIAAEHGSASFAILALRNAS